MTIEQEHADALAELETASTSEIGELMAKAVDAERRLKIALGLEPADPSVYGAYWNA